jgi:arginyl-tRNA synthetase
MSVVSRIKFAAAKAFNHLYNYAIDEDQIIVNATKPEFEGEYTIVLFAFIKQLKKPPEILAQKLGNILLKIINKYFRDLM